MQELALPVLKPPTSTDWSIMYCRLKAARTTLEPVMLTPDAKRTILRARAQALAREPEREETAGETLQVVEFTLAYETYAIELGYVREVYPLKELTPLPCTPAYVLGI